MIITESDMYQDLKKHFYKSLIQRIESPSTRLGISDIFFRTSESEGWMELKILKRFPIYTTIKINFRPGQLTWLKCYSQLGGCSILLIYSIELKNYYIIKNKKIKSNYVNKKDFLNSVSYSGGMIQMKINDLKA